MKKDKSEAAYTLMIDTYKTMGIDTVDKAYAEKTYIRKKACCFSILILVCLLLLSIFLSKWIVFWVMIGLFTNIWIWMSAIYGFRFIDRYILEELKT